LSNLNVVRGEFAKSYRMGNFNVDNFDIQAIKSTEYW